jgi:hypothetical protein
MTTYTDTIEVSIDLAKLWQDVTGEFFSQCSYWLPAVRFFTKGHTWEAEEWDESNKVAFIYENHEGEGYCHAWLKAEDFAKARVELHKEGWTHCGNYGISLIRGEYGFEGDDDACTIDAIVQKALFGKIIYG